MENMEYLNGIAYELMGDQAWELPPECRFFLVADLAWTLMSI